MLYIKTNHMKSTDTNCKSDHLIYENYKRINKLFIISFKKIDYSKSVKSS